jgi:hypothetical protein
MGMTWDLFRFPIDGNDVGSVSLLYRSVVLFPVAVFLCFCTSLSLYISDVYRQVIVRRSWTQFKGYNDTSPDVLNFDVFVTVSAVRAVSLRHGHRNDRSMNVTATLSSDGHNDLHRSSHNQEWHEPCPVTFPTISCRMH